MTNIATIVVTIAIAVITTCVVSRNDTDGGFVFLLRWPRGIGHSIRTQNMLGGDNTLDLVILAIIMSVILIITFYIGRYMRQCEREVCYGMDSDGNAEHVSGSRRMQSSSHHEARAGGAHAHDGRSSDYERYTSLEELTRMVRQMNAQSPVTTLPQCNGWMHHD